MSIAATVGVPVITGVPACIHDGFVALERLQVNKELLLYLLKSSEQELRVAGQSGSQMNVNTSIVKSLVVTIPTNREEQARIASALGDVDDLIASLERLIAKKRAIKQGMMQELLTGRTRLPGFEQPWSAVRLGDQGTTYGGLTGKSAADFHGGNGRFITFMHVISNVRVDGSRLASVRLRRGERQNAVMVNDVLLNGSSETPEELAMGSVVTSAPVGIYLNSFCFGFRTMRTDRLFPPFLAYLLRSDVGRGLLAASAQGATRYNLSKKQFLAIEIGCPKVEEQRAIVNVLVDADAEIEALQRRLEATRAIKTGMMQELLTGRTRLPVDGLSP